MFFVAFTGYLANISGRSHNGTSSLFFFDPYFPTGDCEEMGGCVIAELLAVVSERPEFISLLLLEVVWHPANSHTAAAM